MFDQLYNNNNNNNNNNNKLKKKKPLSMIFADKALTTISQTCCNLHFHLCAQRHHIRQNRINEL